MFERDAVLLVVTGFSLHLPCGHGFARRVMRAYFSHRALRFFLFCSHACVLLLLALDACC